MRRAFLFYTTGLLSLIVSTGYTSPATPVWHPVEWCQPYNRCMEDTERKYEKCLERGYPQGVCLSAFEGNEGECSILLGEPYCTPPDDPEDITLSQGDLIIS